MKRFFRLLLPAALCFVACGAAEAGDLASGTGWRVSDTGVLTVGKDYTWVRGHVKCGEAWKEYASKVTKVVVEKGVTEIGDYAFCDFPQLASVELPSGLKVIENWAFRGCGSLTGVPLPESLTEIEYRAFESCKSLKTIVIPNGVAEIGEFAFLYCESLVSASLPEGLTKIESCIFANCTSLKSVSIPASVTSIAESAFESCVSLADVELPSGLTTIGMYAFFRCKSLTRITLPATLTAVGERAFRNCFDLKYVVSLAEAVPSFGTDAFSEINCPLIVPAASLAAYKGSKWAEFLDVTCMKDSGQGWVLTDEGDLIVDETYVWKAGPSATACAEGWKGSLDDIKFVELTGGVGEVGASAFNGCASMIDVIFGKGVKKVGAGAFAGCAALKEVESLADVPPSLGENSFNQVAGAKLNVPYETDEAYKASDWAKYFSTIESEIGVGNGWSVTTDGTLIVKPEYVWTNESDVNQCSEEWADFNFGITRVVVKDGCTEVGNGAFYDFYNLRSVSLPESLTKIGESAFCECEDLAAVRLPEGVTSIGYGAFSFCGSLKSVNLPKGLTEIADDLFYDCPLGNVSIPDGVTTIGAGAFANCYEIEALQIPASVTVIGSEAFRACDGLSRVISLSTTPPALREDVFKWDDCPLFVPAEALEAYKASEWATCFTEIYAIEDIPSATVEVGTKEEVYVVDGVITVGGEPATDVYTLSGRKAPAGAALGKGLYIVKTPAGAVKVAVR